MFSLIVEEIADGTGLGGRIGEVTAQVNSVVDAGAEPVAVRLCVGLGVVSSALADMPVAARTEMSYRIIAALLGADPVAGEADAGAVATISGDLTATPKDGGSMAA